MIEYPVAVVQARVARRRELEAQLEDLAAVLGCAPADALATARRWRKALTILSGWGHGDEPSEPLSAEDSAAFLDWQYGELIGVRRFAHDALGQATPAQDGDRSEGGA